MNKLCWRYDPAGTGDTDLTAFKAESRRLFQELGWTVHEGENGVCDTVTKDWQDLYLHPTSFSGVLDEANIPSLQEQLSSTQSFRCYAVDCYEEYLDMSDAEYRNVLESNQGEYVTDRNGRIVLNSLTPGTTIIVKEVRAADGYVLDGQPQSVLIKEGEA